MRGTKTAFLPKLAADLIIEITVFRQGWGVQSLGLALLLSRSSAISTGALSCQKSWGLMKFRSFESCGGVEWSQLPGKRGIWEQKNEIWEQKKDIWEQDHPLPPL